MFNTSAVPPLTMGPVQVGIGEGSLAVGLWVRTAQRGDVRPCHYGSSFVVSLFQHMTQHNTTVGKLGSAARVDERENKLEIEV